ncbi:MAG: tRNA pseudouridine(38-40) synthase TruA [Candidatus Omnitrophica bacterium]|nr:tRNA pseudouridine(38-40) synthase TruA [Candidatus Omnitrophota bacterium]
MRTLKLTIAYDGTRYAGWQVQPGSKPTIQGVLQDALRRILGERVSVLGSGRTDAGVHAVGQVAHLRTRASMAPERLFLALNHLLPPDIAVRDVREAPEQFHAQFDAVSKRYRYRLVNGPIVLPFERPYVQQIRAPLNARLMQREAAVLRGRHDMAPFQRTGRPVRDTRRTISDISVRRQACLPSDIRGGQGSLITIEIEADGFLYMMVRIIVGTLINIGRGYRPPGTIARILRTRDKRLVGPTAPARGLMLLQVRY